MSVSVSLALVGCVSTTASETPDQHYLRLLHGSPYAAQYAASDDVLISHGRATCDVLKTETVAVVFDDLRSVTHYTVEGASGILTAAVFAYCKDLKPKVDALIAAGR